MKKLANLFFVVLCFLSAQIGYSQTIYCIGQPAGTSGATASALHGTTVTVNCGTTNKFRDPAGGLDGSTSYAVNQTFTVTFCSSSGDPLYFDFRAFSSSFNLDAGTGDSLYFFDSPSGALITVLTQSDDYASSEVVVGTTSTCVTVRWVSNGSGVDGGWDAVLSCTPPPPSCSGGNPPAADLFLQAPTICNLNGYCGVTSTYYGEDAPYNFGGTGGDCPVPTDGLFGGTLQNNSWLKFQAASTSITFTFTISGGASCSGVQAGIFAFDPLTQVFTRKSPCAPTDGSGLAPGTSNLTATGLTVGEFYWLMMDGNAGSVCDYVINAPVGGVVVVNAGTDQVICPGESTTLSASGPLGTVYTWTLLDGTPVGSGSSISVTPSSTTTYVVSASGICESSTDQVVVDVGCVLPVELLQFTANCSEKEVFLYWQTASEYNNDYFVIEESENGTDWVEVGTVDSHFGTSSTIEHYDYVTPKTSQARVYYRLKQVDVDGRIHYSSVSSVDCAENEEIKDFVAFPNPSVGNLSIKGLPIGTKLKVISSLGVQLGDFEVDAMDYELDLRHYANGVYLLYAVIGEKVLVKKIKLDK